ncbi:hypothetical protein AAMO2058_001416100 [Amorphochlora amoebiformis]
MSFSPDFFSPPSSLALISCIKGLSSCKALRNLQLHHNHISNLKGCLRKSKLLETLSVAHNRLHNLDSTLASLTHLSALQNLELSGNPLCEEVNYRKRVIKALPWLQVLDNHIIPKNFERKKGQKLPFGRSFSGKPKKECKQVPFGQSTRKSKETKRPRTLYSDLAKKRRYLDNRSTWFKCARGLAADAGVSTMEKLLEQRKLPISVVNLRERGTNLTGLMLGANAPSIAVVNFLLDKKADPDLQSPSGDTCLHVATRQNNPRMVKILLLYKADSTIRNKAGLDPLMLAENSKHRECRDLIVASRGIFRAKHLESDKLFNFKSTQKFSNSPFQKYKIGPEVIRVFTTITGSATARMGVNDFEGFVGMLRSPAYMNTLSVEDINALFGKKKSISLKELHTALQNKKWTLHPKSHIEKLVSEIRTEIKSLMSTCTRPKSGAFGSNSALSSFSDSAKSFGKSIRKVEDSSDEEDTEFNIKSSNETISEKDEKALRLCQQANFLETFL